VGREADEKSGSRSDLVRTLPSSVDRRRSLIATPQSPRPDATTARSAHTSKRHIYASPTVYLTYAKDIPAARSATAPHRGTQLHSIMHRMLVYVSEQRRLRAERAAKQAVEQRDRMARMQVSDEVWAAFGAGLGTTPVNVAFGRARQARGGALATPHW